MPGAAIPGGSARLLSDVIRIISQYISTYPYLAVRLERRHIHQVFHIDLDLSSSQHATSTILPGFH